MAQNEEHSLFPNMFIYLNGFSFGVFKESLYVENLGLEVPLIQTITGTLITVNGLAVEESGPLFLKTANLARPVASGSRGYVGYSNEVMEVLFVNVNFEDRGYNITSYGDSFKKYIHSSCIICKYIIEPSPKTFSSINDTNFKTNTPVKVGKDREIKRVSKILNRFEMMDLDIFEDTICG